MALFPPVVASSMPCFAVDLSGKGSVKVYFTLSNYNGYNKNNIKSVLVSVRRQSSNINVVRDYGLLVKQMQATEEDMALKRYYVEINSSDLRNNFQVGALYKVQLRFSTSKFDNISIISQAYNFLSHPEWFSEWSTVTLIKPIIPPTFYVDEFRSRSTADINSDVQVFYNYSLADFTIIFNKANNAKQIQESDNDITPILSSEGLKSWRLRLLSGDYQPGITKISQTDTDTSQGHQNRPSIQYDKIEQVRIDDYLIADSGWVLASAYNYTLDQYDSMVMECSLPYEFSQYDKYEGKYKLLLQINTTNDYKASQLYSFSFYPVPIAKPQGNFTTSINEEEGYIKISYTPTDSYIANFCFRRTDARSNFLKWEDLKNFVCNKSSEGEEGSGGSFIYYDFTAESGTIYQYLVQRRDERGRRGQPLKTENKIMAEWQHPMLLQTVDDNHIQQSVLAAKQLKLKYDFEISNFKTNISQSKTDTIGSKYPFIRKNGNMYYRSFSCSGLITGYMDNIELFTKETKLLHNQENLYKQFKGEGNYLYPNQYDYTYERKFREQVEAFLYNSKPKLYKSMQQGNIFIKLMDVSLTPKNELGRLIYSFTATAYEIAEPTLANFNYYGLLNTDIFNPNVYYIKVKYGQLNSYDNRNNAFGKVFKAGKDIISDVNYNQSIAYKYSLGTSINNQIVTDFGLFWLRLTFESPPYLIKYDSGKGRFYPIDDVDVEKNNFLKKDRKYIPVSNTTTTMKLSEDQDKLKEVWNDAKITSKLYQIESTYTNTKEEDNNIYLGHLFRTEDGTQIIVSNPNDIYELKGSDIQFMYSKFQLIPYRDEEMTVDFLAKLHIEYDESKMPKRRTRTKTTGQIMGTYVKSLNLISVIRNHYYYRRKDLSNNINIRTYLQGVNYVDIDTEPGTVLYMRTSVKEDSLHRFVVNHTGQISLNPYDRSVFITDLYIYGINVPKKYINNTGKNSRDSVERPVQGDLCEQNGQKYIYYMRKWRKATVMDADDDDWTYDIECPVDTMVFYHGEIRSDQY